MRQQLPGAVSQSGCASLGGRYAAIIRLVRLRCSIRVRTGATGDGRVLPEQFMHERSPHKLVHRARRQYAVTVRTARLSCSIHHALRSTSPCCLLFNNTCVFASAGSLRRRRRNVLPSGQGWGHGSMLPEWNLKDMDSNCCLAQGDAERPLARIPVMRDFAASPVDASHHPDCFAMGCRGIGTRACWSSPMVAFGRRGGRMLDWMPLL